MEKAELLSRVQLYVIADKKLCGSRDVEEVAAETIAGGAQMIQYRDKESNYDRFLSCARKLREMCRESEVPFIVNDQAVVAAEINADGVHLGHEDLPIREAQKILGLEKIVGKTVRTIRQAKMAEDEGADYAGLGPIFHTDSKQIDELIGVDVIRRASESLNIPFFVIGGINLDNLDQVIKAGGKRIAVISAIVSSDDVIESTRKLLQKLRSQNPT